MNSDTLGPIFLAGLNRALVSTRRRKSSISPHRGNLKPLSIVDVTIIKLNGRVCSHLSVAHYAKLNFLPLNTCSAVI